MIKFIVTKELGKLARWLRILGFDTVYYNNDSIGTLVIKALSENRAIVTRRRKTIGNLEKETVVVRSEKIKGQIKEVMEKLRLDIDESKIFTRCTVCNGILKRVDKDRVKGSVPEYAFKAHDVFMRCVSCGKVYWQGAHWGGIRRVLAY